MIDRKHASIGQTLCLLNTLTREMFVLLYPP